MAKGPEITDEVRMLIARLHKEHPKWTNKMIRNEVLCIVHKRDPSLPKDWPSKFSIDRIMPGIRERVKRSRLEPNPLDKPWTIQTMVKYPIPPGALPSVLRVWFLHELKYSITIREAQWIARLYTAIEDTNRLAGFASRQAWREKLAQDAGIEDFMGYQMENMFLSSIMTGHVITREEEKKLLQELWADVGDARPFEEAQYIFDSLHKHYQALGIRFETELQEEKEAKNERKHQTKKQK